MRQLLLLRHAKSSWHDKTLPDRNRPLAPRGQRAAAAMASAMRELGLCPDLVLVSTARRTLETLEALEPWDETPLIEPLDPIYLASAQQLLTLLNEVAETVRSVLLIGHNPGLHELAVTLAGLDRNPAKGESEERLKRGFPTAALAEFAVPGLWSRLGTDRTRLVRFIVPADLTGPIPD